MAKAKTQHSAAFVPLRQVYAEAFEKFRSPKPALAAVRHRLKHSACRYFDADGNRHNGDLTADFIDHATIDPDAGSAVHTMIVTSRGRIPPRAAYNIELRAARTVKKAPYAEHRRWKKLVRARFEHLCASGGIAKGATLEATAKQLANWLEIEHKIVRSWQMVQSVLPARRSWPAVSPKV
jgi:hypothetical protein